MRVLAVLQLCLTCCLCRPLFFNVGSVGGIGGGAASGLGGVAALAGIGTFGLLAAAGNRNRNREQNRPRPIVVAPRPTLPPLPPLPPVTPAPQPILVQNQPNYAVPPPQPPPPPPPPVPQYINTGERLNSVVTTVNSRYVVTLCTRNCTVNLRCTVTFCRNYTVNF